MVRRAFADEDADIYLLVDGDGTYDASVAPDLVQLVAKGHDLVNAAYYRSPTTPAAATSSGTGCSPEWSRALQPGDPRHALGL